MNKASVAFSWISGIAGAATSAGAIEIVGRYLPNVSGVFRVLIVSLFSMAALFLVQLAINTIPKLRLGRKLLLGDAWIEGWWYLQTFNDNTGNPIPPGLMFVTYKGPSLDLHITVYRQPQHENGPISAPLVTRSSMAALREYDCHLLNYCIFPEEKAESRSLGVGNFSTEESSHPPKRYEGVVIRLSDAPHRRQAGVKIEPREIRAFQKQHGNAWIDEMIKKCAAGPET